jgi:hypothetical protein
VSARCHNAQSLESIQLPNRRWNRPADTVVGKIPARMMDCEEEGSSLNLVELHNVQESKSGQLSNRGRNRTSQLIVGQIPADIRFIRDKKAPLRGTRRTSARDLSILRFEVEMTQSNSCRPSSCDVNERFRQSDKLSTLPESETHKYVTLPPLQFKNKPIQLVFGNRGHTVPLHPA